MTTRNQIKAEEATRRYTRRHAREIVTGILGNNAGTVVATTDTRWYWVRLHGDPNQVVRAWNAGFVPAVDELPVDIEIVRGNGVTDYQIVGLSINKSVATDPYAKAIGAHALQHQRRDLGEGGFDPVDVYMRALIQTRARAQVPASMTLYIEKGWYGNLGQTKKWTGGNSPAFTAPAGSAFMPSRRCDLLYIASDDTAKIGQGTATTDGSLPGYPSTPSDCCYPLAMVFLDWTTTSIDETHIEDARSFGSTGGGSAANIAALIHAATGITYPYRQLDEFAALDSTGGAYSLSKTTWNNLIYGVKTSLPGLNLKTCRMATTSAGLPVTFTFNPAVQQGQLIDSINQAITIDGVSPAWNDYVLVKDFTQPEANGIYQVSQAGTPDPGGGPTIMQRRELLYSDQVECSEVFVREGAVNALSTWKVQIPGPYTINTTPIVWEKMAGPGDTFSLTGDISPAQIVANQNNYNPTGLATASVLRLSTDAARDLTGLAGGADGRIIVIHNVGAQNLVLRDESASSTAGNRFALSADITLAGDDALVLQYDSTSTRWRCIGKSLSVGTPAAHDMLTAHTYTGGAALDVFGLSAANTIAKLTPSNDVSAGTSAILKSDASGDLTLKHLTITPGSGAGAVEALKVFAGNTGASGPCIGFYNYYGAGAYPTWQMAQISSSYNLSVGAWSGELVFSTNPGTLATTLIERMRIKTDGTIAVSTGAALTGVGSLVLDKAVAQMSDVLGANYFLQCGGPVGWKTNGYYSIGFGYNSIGQSPAIIAYQETDDIAYTFGDLLMATRPVNTNTAAIERWRLTSAGLIIHVVSNATTNAIDNLHTVKHNSSGTPAAGFGTGLLFDLQSSTTADQNAALLTAAWVDATHASRKARAVLTAYDTAAREILRGEASGTAPMIGFLGTVAQALPAAYTQTYATATRTHANPTAAAVSDTNGSAGFAAAADRTAAVTAINNLVADVANVKQVVNQILDDLQGYGLLA